MFLKLGFPPETTLWIGIVISIIALIARLIIIKKLVKLKVHNFIKQVIIICLEISFISLLIPLIISLKLENTIMRFLIVSFFSIIISIISVYIFGLDSNEKIYFKKQTIKILNRFKTIKK